MESLAMAAANKWFLRRHRLFGQRSIITDIADEDDSLYKILHRDLRDIQKD